MYGPATFLYQSVAQIQQVLQGQIGATQQTAERAAREARRQAAAAGASAPSSSRPASGRAGRCFQAFQSELVRLGLKFGITSPPRLDDPQFINRVVFDPRESVGTPRSASHTSSSTTTRPDLGAPAPRPQR